MRIILYKAKYTVFLLLILFSCVGGKQSKSTATNPFWQLIDSPTKTKLNYIDFFPDKNGLIIGDKILEYNGEKWTFAIHPPTIEKIDRFSVINRNDFWISTLNILNQSDLYHFKNNKWTTEASPLANQITAIHFLQNGCGWAGGVGELAFNNGKNWKYFPSPIPEEAFLYIFGNEQGKAWIQVSIKYLFFFDNGKWERILPDKNIHACYFTSLKDGWILSEDELYLVKNGILQLHSRNNLFSKIASIYTIDKNNIWAAGANGLILHFTNGKWEKINSGTNKSLSYIKMQNNESGWAVGAGGTILCYDKTVLAKSRKSPGFDQQKIYSFGREVNDEYGVAIDDFNKDGYKDIYSVCIFDPNRLYINAGENTSHSLYFSEEASVRNVDGVLKHQVASHDLFLGVTSGDIDNDDDPDLYICNLAGENQLYINDGNGYFWNAANQKNRAQGSSTRSNTPILGDVNNDGNLDLFVTNEYSSNKLYLNDGNGYFTDITDEAGLTTKLGGTGASFGDIDNDGDLDLYVTNWYTKNLLFKNEFSETGKIKFTNISGYAGIEGEAYAKSNGVAFADIDNDGDLDLFVTNRKASNRLYINDGTGKFTDKTAEMIGEDSMLSYGCSFADFDDDGFPDLFVANIFEDKFYKNIDGKKFKDVSLEFDAPLGGYSTGTATGDIDNDGDIDLYLANYVNGNSALLINNLDDNRFILLNIEGTISNRDAIGAKVYLYKNGHIGDNNFLLGFREINGGSGYGSISSKEVHFGLLDGEQFDIRIIFPASKIVKDIKDIKPGSRLFVSEESGFARSKTLFFKAVNRFLISPSTHNEIFKTLIVILLLLVSHRIEIKKYHWQKRKRFLYYFVCFLIYATLSGIFMQEAVFLSTVIPLLSVVIYLLFLHLIYERINLINKAKIERQETRDRIARDLHDDLASTISSAFIYSESLRRTSEKQENDNSELPGKISSLLSEASDSITDIVWTVSPYHDSIEDIITKLKSLVSDSCRAKTTQCTFKTNIIDKSISFNQETRKNIYLILKEATNNLIKHSQAKNVCFEIRQENKTLYFLIEDDGIGINDTEEINVNINNIQGFRLHKDSGGNGIYNMIKRAKEIKSEIFISSLPGKGTKIKLVVKMTQMRY